MSDVVLCLMSCVWVQCMVSVSKVLCIGVLINRAMCYPRSRAIHGEHVCATFKPGWEMREVKCCEVSCLMTEWNDIRLEMNRDYKTFSGLPIQYISISAAQQNIISSANLQLSRILSHQQISSATEYHLNSISPAQQNIISSAYLQLNRISSHPAMISQISNPPHLWFSSPTAPLLTYSLWFTKLGE